jgi:hypothetical protein
VATLTQTTGSWSTLTITNIGLYPSLTNWWQSDRVDNLTSTKAVDYEVLLSFAPVNTAPANDKAIYVYAVPWVNRDVSWYASDTGGTLMVTGSEGTATVPNNVNNTTLLGIINNQAINTTMSNVFFLSNAFGSSMPDGWSLLVKNYTGATLTPTGSVVGYKSIKNDIS